MPTRNASSCGLVLDRHIPKNAGTTVRTVLRASRDAGRCRFVGYDVSRTWASKVGFSHQQLGELVAGELSTPRGHYCVEAHVVATEFWAELAALRRTPFAAACPVVVMVRVREPLAWYRSFYDWGVLGRQRANVTTYGANFTDWLPRNMQSTNLLASGSQRMAVLAAVKPSPAEPRTLGEASWRKLMRGLAAVDIVAPMERLDESLVLLGRLAGFLTTTAYERIRPAPVRGPWQKVRPQLPIAPSAEQCASEALCRLAVAHAAPDDLQLYEHATRRFDAQLAALPDDESFARELAAHRAAVQAREFSRQRGRQAARARRRRDSARVRHERA